MPLCGRMPQCFSLCCEFVQGAWDWQEPIPRHHALRVSVCVFPNHIWAQRGAAEVVGPGGLWESGGHGTGAPRESPSYTCEQAALRRVREPLRRGRSMPRVRPTSGGAPTRMRRAPCFDSACHLTTRPVPRHETRPSRRQREKALLNKPTNDCTLMNIIQLL